MSLLKDERFEGLTPFIYPEAEILILGSFPSVKSRADQFYYAHPQNRFWKVLAMVYDEEVPDGTDEKKSFLRRHKLALSDPIACCRVKGSSDASIRDVECRDIQSLIFNTSVAKIICNGKTSLKYALAASDLEYICCPSTSAANAAWHLDDLVIQYKKALL